MNQTLYAILIEQGYDPRRAEAAAMLVYPNMAEVYAALQRNLRRSQHLLRLQYGILTLIAISLTFDILDLLWRM